MARRKLEVPTKKIFNFVFYRFIILLHQAKCNLISNFIATFFNLTLSTSSIEQPLWPDAGG